MSSTILVNSTGLLFFYWYFFLSGVLVKGNLTILYSARMSFYQLPSLSRKNSSQHSLLVEEGALRKILDNGPK